MRVLGRIRLSRATDESTSAVRQRELIETWAQTNEHEIVGWAEDLDVSGSVDPFNTPALGPWLTDKLDDWDILVSWKLDRLARRAVPLHRLFGLCEDHEKTLVCISDNIDLSTWVGRLIASVIAGVAEGELEAIRERTRASRRKLRELGRWSGGKTPYGYRAEERTDGPGWHLVPDEYASAIIRDVVNRVLAGESVSSISAGLNADGVLPPADYRRQRDGAETKGAQWHHQSLRELLKSKTLLGYVTHAGTTVRDDEGLPINRGDPIVTLEEFGRLQLLLDSASRPKASNRTTGTSPMLGVALCLDCERPLHHRNQKFKDARYRYYYCPDKHGQQVRAETVEELVEETFLDAVGDLEVEEKVVIPAENHEIELEQAIAAVEEITPLLGTVTSTTMRKRLTEQLTALDFRISQLENLPVAESRVELRPTGKTYRDTWESSSTEERRALLIRAGITMTIQQLHKVRNGPPGTLEYHLRIPEDILERLA